MNTKFPEIFDALAAPFDDADIKVRPGDRGRKLSYVTARTVMNRLDDVLGPENWWDDYLPSPVGSQGVKCLLTIRLPDGQTVTKAGLGGVTLMQDPSDTDKTGESDSLKRASVKFLIGRYLYQDDKLPSRAADTSTSSNSARPMAKSSQFTKPVRKGSYQEWLTAMAAEAEAPDIWALHRHIVSLLKESNYDFGCDTTDNRAIFRAVAQMFSDGKAADWLADAVNRFKASQSQSA